MEFERKMFLWQQTYATLFSVSNKLQVLGDKHIGVITSRQLMAMIAIAHLPPEGASLNGIAKKLATTKQNTRQLINALVKKGFVLQEPSRIDKRACNIVFTENGKRALIDSANRGMVFFAEVFKDFPDDELEQLWGYLKKLYCFDGEEQDDFEAEVNI